MHKDVFPNTKLVHFCECHYHSKGADARFDPEFPLSKDDMARIRSRNALHLLNLENCDVGITPAKWQHGLHPRAYQHKIKIVHEGVDSSLLGPDDAASIRLANGKTLRVGGRIITYVARNLEPYRGFHVFMRSLSKLLREDKSCEVVIVRGGVVSYGGAA